MSTQPTPNINEQSTKNRASIWTIIFLLLFLICLAYIVYQKTQLNKYATTTSSQSLVSNLQTKEQEVVQLQQKLDSLRRANQALQNSNGQQGNDGVGEGSSNNSAATTEGTSEGTSEVHFEVQIGAFQYFDLDEYYDGFQHLREEQEGKLDKYTLAKFKTYEQATNFKLDIQKMGLTGAFVIGKLNGERIEINEAIKLAKEEL